MGHNKGGKILKEDTPSQPINQSILHLFVPFCCLIHWQEFALDEIFSCGVRLVGKVEKIASITAQDLKSKLRKHKMLSVNVNNLEKKLRKNRSACQNEFSPTVAFVLDLLGAYSLHLYRRSSRIYSYMVC